MVIKYQTIQQNLSKIKYLFWCSGMKLHQNRAPGTNPLKYRAAYFFHLIWFNFDCTFTLSFLLLGILNGKNFTELSFVGSCVTFSVLALAKTLCYTFNDVKAYQLVEDLIRLDADRKDCNNLAEVNEIKATETNFLGKVLKVLNFLYILLMILYDTGPLVGTVITYYMTDELRLFLPFLDVYPFDALDLKYWPYIFIHQIWSVCLVLFYVGSVDCFLITCCTYIKIQFRLVKLDIENIIPHRNISEQVRNDIQFQDKLNELVRRHQEIIRLSHSLREIYSLSILFNVIISSIIICLTGFNVTVIKELTLVLPSIAFFCTCLVQVFCLCYFGDMLSSSSEAVSGAVYASRWYLGDKEIAKKLLIILIRAQKPCGLTASGFLEVNLRSFMKILSTSWSYFALLKTMYSK